MFFLLCKQIRNIFYLSLGTWKTVKITRLRHKILSQCNFWLHVLYTNLNTDVAKAFYPHIALKIPYCLHAITNSVYLLYICKRENFANFCVENCLPFQKLSLSEVEIALGQGVEIVWSTKDARGAKTRSDVYCYTCNHVWCFDNRVYFYF